MDPELMALFGITPNEQGMSSPMSLSSDQGWAEYLDSLQPQQQLPPELRDPQMRQTPNQSPVSFEGGQARTSPMPEGGGSPMPNMGAMDPNNLAYHYMTKEEDGPSAQDMMGSLLSMVPRHTGEKSTRRANRQNPYIQSLLGLR